MRVYGRDGQLALLVNLVDAQWTSPFRRPDRSGERLSVGDRPGLAWTTASTKAACHDGCKHPGQGLAFRAQQDRQQRSSDACPSSKGGLAAVGARLDCGMAECRK